MPDSATTPMPLSTMPDENRQDKERRGLMLPPPLPLKEHSTPIAPPRMTRLPSLKELSTHLHYTPSSTSSAQLPNPLATPDRTRASASGSGSVPATPPSLRISTNPATLAQGTPGGGGVGASPLVAPSPSSRLKLPASAMMRSLSSGPGSSGPAFMSLHSASASPVDRRASLATGLGGLESIRSPGWSSRDFAGSKDIFANLKSDAAESPNPTQPGSGNEANAESSTSMSRGQSMDAFIQGYKTVPSLDQLRRRVSLSRGASYTSSVGSTSAQAEIKDQDKSEAEQETAAEAKIQSSSEAASASQGSTAVSISGAEAGAKMNAGLGAKPRNKQEHPLQHAWTLYFDSKSYKPDPSLQSAKDASLLADYEKTLVSVGKFDTVEGFARYLNNVRLPSGLAKNSNYHMFKNGIRPMWEDPANAHGGKWVILFRSSPATLDVAWANLTMALVGEILDPEDQVCGIVASNRPKIDRLQIWTRGREDVDKLNQLGKRIVDAMALEGRDAEAMSMEFQYNASNAHPPAGKFIHIPFPSTRTPLATPQPNRLSMSGTSGSSGGGPFQGAPPPGMNLSINPSPHMRGASGGGPLSPSFPPPPKSPTYLNVPGVNGMQHQQQQQGDPIPPAPRGRLGSSSGANAFSGPMGGMGGMGMNRLDSGSPLKKEGSPARAPVAVGAGGGA